MSEAVKFTKVLVIDTAMHGINVSVYDAARDAVVCDRLDTLRGQASHLVPMVDVQLAKAGLTYAELDVIVTTLGPGSFTGLRIGMSTAKSYGLALEIPVYGVSTLQALALGYASKNDGDEAEIAVLIETKRSDFYFQMFDASGVAIGEAAALEAEDINIPDGAVLIGDAVERFCGQDKQGLVAIDAGLLASVFVKDNTVFTGVIEPIYLRGADVSVSKREQRVLEDL